MFSLLYVFARAAIAKCHRAGDLNNENLFAHSSGGRKSKIKILSGSISPEASP